MFAPPPVQLSRAEIQTRLTGEGKSTDGNDSPKKGLGKSLSLHRREPKTPTSPRRFFFSKSDKAQKSPPTIDRSYRTSPERQHASAESSNKLRAERERLINLPEGFGENPRPAPAPPTRSTPVSGLDTQWTPRVPGAFSLPADPRPENHKGNGTPPPIPPKSEKRPKIAIANPESTQTFGQQSSTRIESSHPATASEELKNEIAAVDMTAVPVLQRASTTPHWGNPQFDTAASRVPGRIRSSTWDAEQPRLPRSVGTSSRWPEVTGFRVRKPLTGRRPRRGRSPLAAEIEFSGNGVRDNQPLSLMGGPGFSQNGESSRNWNVTWSLYGTEALDRLQFVDKPLPETPRSITLSPTEIVQSAQASPLSILRSYRLRSPLAQISPTHGKANSSTFSDDGISPSRLSSIPEHTANNEKSPLTSGSRAAGATRIHLRGGSLLTVSPPELTPWQPTIYIQGPIKLPKPVIVPRKNSVASLEPFQEAIDQVYQDALNIPRRRSDDKVLDDVCEFFDDFGFEEISFEGDILVSELLEIGESMEMDAEKDLERFSTPPGEPRASPVEKRVAQDIVELMTGQLRLPDWQIQPEEKEDALQKEGIPAFAKPAATEPGIMLSNRRDSMTLSAFDTGISPLLSVEKECMPNGAQEQRGNAVIATRLTAEQGLDWDNEVEELDSSSTWVAPAASKPRCGLNMATPIL